MAVLAWLLSYLVGAIPFGVLVARARKVDIRAHGSGNIGASNVLRVLGVKFGLLVFLLDVGKGLIGVQLSRWLVPQESGGAVWVTAASAVIVIVGHNWSVFLGFTGGKGVASSLGAMLGLSWPAALIGLGLWILIVAVTRYISVGSMIAISTVPFVAAALHAPGAYVLAAAILAVMCVTRHRDNIQRLRTGTENRIGQRVKVVTEEPLEKPRESEVGEAQ